MDIVKLMKRGPRGAYDLLESLRRAKVTNMTGACFTDEAADEIERLRAEIARLRKDCRQVDVDFSDADANERGE